MRILPLGKTGLQISELGYGCGGFWGHKLFPEAEAIRLVHEAIDLGVTFFDTGASYCGGRAEDILGSALKARPQASLVIGSKAGTVHSRRGLKKDFTPASLEKQLHESLRKLGREQLDVWQLHAPRASDMTDAVLEKLQRMKEQGFVKAVGASIDARAFERAVTCGGFDVLMVTFNVIEKEALPWMEKAYAQGIGLIGKSPLCHRLYAPESLLKIRKPGDVWYLLRALKNYRQQMMKGRHYRFMQHDAVLSADEIALLYALHPLLSCTVVGTTRLENLRRNIHTVDKALPDALRQKIDSINPPR